MGALKTRRSKLTSSVSTELCAALPLVASFRACHLAARFCGKKGPGRKIQELSTRKMDTDRPEKPGGGSFPEPLVSENIIIDKGEVLCSEFLLYLFF